MGLLRLIGHMLIKWKPVFVGVITDKYRVNNLGQVQSVKTDRILKPYYPGGSVRGYVRLFNKDYLVDKIVWESFIGLCPEDKTLIHKDGDYKNNHIENLELIEYFHHKSKLSFIEKEHIKILRRRQLSQQKIAKRFGITQQNVNLICNNNK